MSPPLGTSNLVYGRTGAFRYVRMYEVSTLVRNVRPHSVTVCYSLEVAVPILGTGKLLYQRKLGLFAMYVCTRSVRTYIAKTLKRTIHTILYGTKLTQASPFKSSSHFDMLPITETLK